MSDSVSICVDDIPHPVKCVQSLLFRYFRFGLAGDFVRVGVLQGLGFVKCGSADIERDRRFIFLCEMCEGSRARAASDSSRLSALWQVRMKTSNGKGKCGGSSPSASSGS